MEYDITTCLILINESLSSMRNLKSQSPYEEADLVQLF